MIELLRALVISDTHFGAWTGEDLLRAPENLKLLEPHLNVDEVIVLGDLFDFLFSSLTDAVAAASGLFDLLRERLQGKRLVFLAGNHDHHVVVREAEALLELQLATGEPTERLERALRQADPFCRLLEQRLDGIEIDVRYPTYTFGGVLCTHGHYLDTHARRLGSRQDRLLARLIWSISVGPSRTPTVEDYEATTQLLTGLLYTIAQLPNGTHAQRRVYRAFRSLERGFRIGAAPARTAERVLHWRKARLARSPDAHEVQSLQRAERSYEGARSHEDERRQRTGAPAGGEAASYTFARTFRPSDPTNRPVAAFEQVVDNLRWATDTDKIVFAHTHQPLDGVLGPSGRYRYWNAGSWIYEPDLSSQRAYTAYLRNAWPGTAVLIDTDEPHPTLLRLREHLNPLHHQAHERAA